MTRDALIRALLSAALSHEVKQPLNAMSLSVELLRRRGAAGAHCDALERSVARIETILDAYSVHSSAPPIDEEPIDIRPVLAKIRGVEMLAPKSLPRVAVSAEQLELALEVLVDNARRAAPDQPVTIAVAATDTELTTTVGDRGPGMPPETQKRAYEIGFSTWGRPGIGLTLAKFVAYNHGGGFHIKTGPEGTSVTLSFPL